MRNFAFNFVILFAVYILECLDSDRIRQKKLRSVLLFVTETHA